MKHKKQKDSSSKKAHGRRHSHSSPKRRQHHTAPHAIRGILSVAKNGSGFVRPTDPLVAKKYEKIEIEHHNLGTGLHGDTVEIELLSKRVYGKPSGEVKKVLSRGKFGFSGVLEERNGGYVLSPSDPRMYVPIIIPNQSLKGAKLGEKIFGIITDWTDSTKEPVGEITHVLGAKGDNDAEMRAIALEKGFDESFPKEVSDEAEKQRGPISKEEIARRRDFRTTTTFTIDPEDAKDFDDALSIKELGNDTWEIGIHIADVSHYVRPRTLLDQEARKRATSVYLVDRTIPMLPEALSNDLCSLNPNTDKLAMSAVFVMDKNAKVIGEWYGKTIIHSDKRFTYEEAQSILDQGEGLFHGELKLLNTLAKKLTEKRFEMGAISLETEEVKFKLDQDGVPVSVYKKVRGDTNKLIEEFMLLANRKVAELIGKEGEKSKVFVYRIHDKPAKDRMEDLIFFLRSLGYAVPVKDGQIPPKELNKLIKGMEGQAYKDAVHSVIVRSMAKAIYSTKNIGHFGLAFKFYTHFTSPIRRYPDVIVHRLLEEYLKGGHIKKELWSDYEEASNHSSDREKQAAEAERGSIKYKQVEYMSSRIGQVFTGVITGITEWGMFVEEQETKCEGMLRYKEFTEDTYEFDEKHMKLVGKKTKREYRLGDKLQIKVASADLANMAIDYTRV